MTSVLYGEGIYGADPYGVHIPTAILAVTSITLDGVPLDLDGVLADVTIRHGRAGYFDSASPSTCQVELLGVGRSFTRPFRLGSVLVVNATDGVTIAPRFTGRLTDADLVGDELTAIAVGQLRTLSGYTVGAVAYPEEKWSARLARAFTEVGPRALIANGGFETNIAGWTPNGPGIILGQTNDPHGGANCLYLYGATAEYGRVYSTVTAPLTAGKRYTLRAWLKTTPGGVGAAGMVNLLNNLGSIVAAQHKPLTTAYQLFETTVTLPAGVTSLQVITGADSGLTSDDIVFVDDVEVFDADAPVLELQVGAFDPILVARPAEPVSLAAMLDELAETVESAVADLPDGRILVQALNARTAVGTVALDPAEVAYAPAWEMRLPAANVVTVDYGEPAASVSARDASSVARYGPIAATITTDLKNAGDATTVVFNRLARSAYARWTIPAAGLLFGRRLPIGAPVGLSSLPPAAPFPSWAPVLEGWTDRIVSDGEELVWTMELALSDPLLSGLTLAWEGIPADAAHRWNTINPAVAWLDALTLSDLDP